MKKKRYVIDTNVPIVANGRQNSDGGKQYSIDCREKAGRFVKYVLESGTPLVDGDGAILCEYRKNLDSSRQGIGDLFYREILQRGIAERIDLPKKGKEYQDVPQEIIRAGFHRKDRKFVALAKKENVPVVVAVDSGWPAHFPLLQRHGVCVWFVCGENEKDWFENGV